MKKIDNKVNDEIKDCFENKINSLNNASSLNIDETISFNVEISKKIDLNFFWWWSCTCWYNLMLLENLTKQRLQAKAFARFFSIRTFFCCCSCFSNHRCVFAYCFSSNLFVKWTQNNVILSLKITFWNDSIKLLYYFLTISKKQTLMIFSKIKFLNISS